MGYHWLSLLLTATLYQDVSCHSTPNVLSVHPRDFSGPPDSNANPSPSLSSGQLTSTPTSSISFSLPPPSGTASSSSTTSSAATPDLWLIFPKDPMAAENAALTSRLNDAFGSAMQVTGNEEIGIDFWSAPLTPALVTQFQQSTLVSSVSRNFAFTQEEYDPDIVPSSGDPSSSTSISTDAPLPKRTRIPSPSSNHILHRRTLLQFNARPELAILSSQANNPDAPLAGYVSDGSGGKGITVFVIDSGLKHNWWDNQDLARFVNGGLKYLFAEPDEQSLPWSSDAREREDDNPDLHGTKMSIKAVGTSRGVAQRASLVVVMRPKPRDGTKWVTLVGLVNMFNVIIETIRKDPSIRPVINMSFGLPPRNEMFSSGGSYVWLRKIQQLEDLGAILVAAAGNDGKKNPNNAAKKTLIPALFSAQSSLIAVSASNATYDLAPFSQSGDVMAPGQNIESIPGQFGAGTSYSAAIVSGLAAYLLSTGDVAWEKSSKTGYAMRAKLQELSFPRKEGGPSIVSNGFGRKPAAAAAAGASPSPSSPAPPPPAPKPLTPDTGYTPTTSPECTALQSVKPNPCLLATGQFADTFMYTAYTSYVSVPKQGWFGKKKNSVGCGAVYMCSDPKDYEVGISGTEMKDYLGIIGDPILKEPVCGSRALGNSCRVFIDKCVGTGCNFVAQPGAPPPSG